MIYNVNHWTIALYAFLYITYDLGLSLPVVPQYMTFTNVLDWYCAFISGGAAGAQVHQKSLQSYSLTVCPDEVVMDCHFYPALPSRSYASPEIPSGCESSAFAQTGTMIYRLRKQQHL